MRQPHDSSDHPRFLPAGLTPYGLNNYTNKSLPYHVTEDDLTVPIERFEVEKITRHRSARGLGGVVAVLYKTHWKGLLQPSSERWTSSTPGSTSSTTGPVHYCNINRFSPSFSCSNDFVSHLHHF